MKSNIIPSWSLFATNKLWSCHVISLLYNAAKKPVPKTPNFRANMSQVSITLNQFFCDIYKNVIVNWPTKDCPTNACTSMSIAIWQLTNAYKTTCPPCLTIRPFAWRQMPSRNFARWKVTILVTCQSALLSVLMTFIYTPCMRHIPGVHNSFFKRRHLLSVIACPLSERYLFLQALSISISVWSNHLRKIAKPSLIILHQVVNVFFEKTRLLYLRARLDLMISSMQWGIAVSSIV